MFDARRKGWIARRRLWHRGHIPLVVLLLPIVRFGSWSLGCGTSEGEIGAPCHPAGCHEHDYCDEGVCSGNQCIAYTPTQPTPTCHAQASSVCAADESGFWCPGEGSSTTESVCGAARDHDGGSLYCCPPCTEIGSCDDAGERFACSSSFAPTHRRPELACVVRSRGTVGGDEYCCFLETNDAGIDGDADSDAGAR